MSATPFTWVATVVADLPARWRADADRMDVYGPCPTAAVLRAVADQLDHALRDEAEAVLTVAQAEAESGYSRHHLARELRAGRLRNVGRPYAPRIRRADIPRK